MHQIKIILRSTQRRLRNLLGLGIPSPELTLDTIRLGSVYGGWNIYPEPLVPHSVAYSLGVGEDISLHCASFNATKILSKN